jgi:hypothetical protein
MRLIDAKSAGAQSPRMTRVPISAPTPIANAVIASIVFAVILGVLVLLLRVEAW